MLQDREKMWWKCNAEKEAELIEVIKYLFENLIGDLNKSLLGKMEININNIYRIRVIFVNSLRLFEIN